MSLYTAQDSATFLIIAEFRKTTDNSGMNESIYRFWYFERPALAQQILHTFEFGTGDPIALMGERRIGKTLFLLNDLIPAARKRGMLSIYVDLWQEREQPLEALNATLQAAIDDAQVPASKLGRRLATPVKKLGLAGGSMDFGEEPARQRPNRPHLLVDFLLRQLIDLVNKDILLMLDEVQMLAQLSTGEQIIAAIRTAITKHRDRVRVVFTGSSEAELRTLLFRSRAALYEGASAMRFPYLDEKFVQFVAARASQRLKRTLDLKALGQAFEQLHYRPRLLIDLVLMFVSSGSSSLLTFLESSMAHQLETADFQTQWDALTPLQRAICEAIATARPISAVATRVDYARAVGRSARSGPVATGTVSTALSALLAARLINRAPAERGQYRFDDPLFSAWVRRQSESRK